MADNRLYLADTFNKEYVYFVRDSASGIFIHDVDKLKRFLDNIAVTDYLILVKESDRNAISKKVFNDYDLFE